MQPLFTIAEAANRLGVHKMTVHRAIWRGDLEALRVGRHYRIEEGALRAWMKASRAFKGERREG
jgi:excisionase family DNA binding protein